MKRNVLLLIAFFICLGIQAQTKRYFCEIRGLEHELNQDLSITFDFGYGMALWDWDSQKNRQKLVNPDGHELSFYSMVDAGNYLAQRGWTFVQAYSSSHGEKCIVKWVFCKDAENSEAMMKGIITKDMYKKMHKDDK